jgi:hypothetical protein
LPPDPSSPTTDTAHLEIRWGTVVSGPQYTVKLDRRESTHRSESHATFAGPGASDAPSLTRSPGAPTTNPEDASQPTPGFKARSGMEDAIFAKTRA